MSFQNGIKRTGYPETLQFMGARDFAGIMEKSDSIAIIGAGISGLVLALAFHQQGIKSTVFESRPAPLNIGGAIMLSPNGLRILDNLGLYRQVKAQGYSFETLEFRNPDTTLIDTYPFGSEAQHGYSANRIYRHELITILLKAIKEANIDVVYNKKLSHITAETSDGIRFQFTDGTIHSCDLLIGADGIHSTVRKHMHPSPSYLPQFTGQAGYTASIPATSIPPPLRPTNPITIMTPTSGAFVLAPQKPDASEYLIGKQRRIPGTPSREDWDLLSSNPDHATNFLQADNTVFGPLATSCTTTIPPSTINIWPFYVVPALPSWTSPTNRVILVGDAAHAIPPSAGQGIGQALEDVSMLALLVARITAREIPMVEALRFWETWRRERVERVLEVNRKVDFRRLPRMEGDDGSGEAGTGKETEDWDLDWLYAVNMPAVVGEWVAKRRKEAGEGQGEEEGGAR